MTEVYLRRMIGSFSAWIRNILEEDPRHPKYIHTAHGDGYRFTSE